ncbi:MAG TPA: polysaccharide biosynthesis protein, partial [Thermoguttaceae bacterium]
VGLRPGEKLFEELYVEGEQRLPTSHPKIIVAESQPARPDELLYSILELERLAQMDAKKILVQLSAIVPEYRAPILLLSIDEEPAVCKERRIAA